MRRPPPGHGPRHELLASVPAADPPRTLKKAVDPRRRGGIVRALRPPARPRGGTAAVPAVARSEHRARRRLAVAGGAVAVVLIGAVALLWPRHSGEIDRIAAPGGQLTVDAAQVDFGPTADQAQLADRQHRSGAAGVRDPGGAIRGSPSSGAREPSTPAPTSIVSVVLDRSRAPEGAADSEIRVQSNGGSAVVPVRAVVDRAPEVSSAEATPQSVVVRRCPGSTPAQVRAAIVEESGVGAGRAPLGPARDGGAGEPDERGDRCPATWASLARSTRRATCGGGSAPLTSGTTGPPPHPRPCGSDPADRGLPGVDGPHLRGAGPGTGSRRHGGLAGRGAGRAGSGGPQGLAGRSSCTSWATSSPGWRRWPTSSACRWPKRRRATRRDAPGVGASPATCD